ncbi:MAG: hypothetical protein ACW99G_19610 [Candidatus Thorarchaeota archaeon]|jgi:hypothetical protein
MIGFALVVFSLFGCMLLYVLRRIEVAIRNPPFHDEGMILGGEQFSREIFDFGLLSNISDMMTDDELYLVDVEEIDRDIELLESIKERVVELKDGC